MRVSKFYRKVRCCLSSHTVFPETQSSRGSVGTPDIVGCFYGSEFWSHFQKQGGHGASLKGFLHSPGGLPSPPVRAQHFWWPVPLCHPSSWRLVQALPTCWLYIPVSLPPRWVGGTRQAGGLGCQLHSGKGNASRSDFSGGLIAHLSSHCQTLLAHVEA